MGFLGDIVDGIFGGGDSTSTSSASTQTQVSKTIAANPELTAGQKVTSAGLSDITADTLSLSITDSGIDAVTLQGILQAMTDSTEKVVTQLTKAEEPTRQALAAAASQAAGATSEMQRLIQTAVGPLMFIVGLWALVTFFGGGRGRGRRKT